jgi:hypothetical protein
MARLGASAGVDHLAVGGDALGQGFHPVSRGASLR